MAAGVAQLGLVISAAGQVQRIQSGDSITGLSGAGGGFDVSTAGSLEIGANTATGVTLGKSTVDTTVAGQLLVKEGTGANTGIDTAAAGVLEIGAATATSILIGDAGVQTTVQGDLQVDGNEVVVGTTTFQGNTQIGNAITDTLEVQATVINNSAYGGNVTLALDKTTPHIIAVDTATAGAGQTLAIAAGTGASTSAGGQANYEGGAGGASSGATPGGAGGVCESSGGDGGAGSGTAAAGAGGVGRFEGGDAGPANTGVGANGGNCEILGGAGTGSGSDGQVLIGTSTTSNITIGTSTAPTTIWASGVITATTGYDLNATADGTSGSEAVGVYIGGFVNISPGTSDLQTVLESIDTAIGAVGTPSLSDVIISAGTPDNNVDVSTVIAANPIIFSDGASTSANAVMQISRTGITTSGPGLSITMGPGNEAVTGSGLSVTSGTGATAALVFVNNLGSGNALQVQDGSGDVLVVDAAGAADISPTSGQDFTVTVGGAGIMALTSAAALNPLFRLTQATEARATAGDFAEAIECVSTGTDAASFSILFGIDNPNTATAVDAGDVGSLFVDTVTPGLWQKTAASTWSQFGSGSTPSLSDVIISAGTPDNNVDVSTVIAANPVILADGGSTNANAVFTVSRTGTTPSGAGISVTMGPGNEATVGAGISITAGTASTGAGLNIAHTGTGGPITALGTAPTAGTGGDINLKTSDGASATATAGNVILSSVTTAGTEGGVAIGVGDSEPSPNAGQLLIQRVSGNITTQVSIDSSGNMRNSADASSTTNTGTWTGGCEQTGGSTGSAGNVTLQSNYSTTSTSSGGAGDVLIQSTVTQSTGTGTSGDVTLQTTVSNTAGATGDVYVGAWASNGATIGGVQIAATNGFTAPAAGEIKLNAQSDFDVDAGGNIELLAQGTASFLTAVSSTLTISTTTSGTLAVTSAGVLDLDGTSVTIDSTGDVSIDGVTSSNISLSGAAAVLTLSSTAVDGDVQITAGATTGEINFTARGGTVGFNEADFTVAGQTIEGQTLDTGFVASSIIGALNELKTGLVPFLLSMKKTVNSTTAIVAGEPVAMVNEGGNPRAYPADADIATNQENALGLAFASGPTDTTSYGTGSTIVVVTAGEMDVPDAAFTGGSPAAANVGDPVFVSATAGRLTLTAPTGAARVLKIGFVTQGGTNTVKVLINTPDSIKL